MADLETARKASELLAEKLVQALRRGDEAFEILRKIKTSLVYVDSILDEILDKEFKRNA